MKMNASIYKKAASGVLVLVLPLLAGCSVFSGGGLSSDPVIASQQREVRDLEEELEEAERYTKEAKERERAAKNRLKAAEHELKALEAQAKRRGY
jgi:small-conductance mechanosensitive channel